MLGRFTDFQPKFSRQFVNINKAVSQAVQEYAQAVIAKTFPAAGESFYYPKQLLGDIQKLKQVRLEQNSTVIVPV